MYNDFWLWGLMFVVFILLAYLKGWNDSGRYFMWKKKRGRLKIVKKMKRVKDRDKVLGVLSKNEISEVREMIKEEGL